MAFDMKKITFLFVCMMSLCAFGQQQTHWQSPNNFSGSVTVQGILVVNGVEYLGDDIEIGAFCGEQCRGAGLPYGTMVMGHRLYFISIGGDNDNDLITFRLWDHETNQELEYECQTSITFHDNDNYGQMGNWFPIEFLHYQTQEVLLAQGWNWWAPTVATSIETVEQALGDKLVSIQSKQGPASGEAIAGDMYRIQTNAACTLSLSGMPMGTATVALQAGSNWFGYTGDEEKAIAEAVSVEAATGDKIVSQNGGFAIYNGTAWQGTLTTLQPGFGYVYVATENKTLTIE